MEGQLNKEKLKMNSIFVGDNVICQICTQETETSLCLDIESNELFITKKIMNKEHNLAMGKTIGTFKNFRDAAKVFLDQMDLDKADLELAQALRDRNKPCSKRNKVSSEYDEQAIINDKNACPDFKYEASDFR